MGSCSAKRTPKPQMQVPRQEESSQEEPVKPVLPAQFQTDFDRIYQIQSRLTNDTLLVKKYEDHSDVGMAASINFDSALENQNRILKVLQLNHPCLVNLNEVYQNQQCGFLIFEVPKGDPWNTSQHPIKDNRLTKIIRRIFKAIELLHSIQITHGRIDNTSFLFRSDTIVQLQGYLIKSPYEVAERSNKACSTRTYFQSPEYINTQKSTMASDIYSIGIMIYYIISGGNFPFTEKTERGVQNQITYGAITFDQNLVSKTSDDILSMVKTMLHKNPAHRPSAKILLNHKFKNTKLSLQPVIKQMAKKERSKLDPSNLQYIMNQSYYDYVRDKVQYVFDGIDSDNRGFINRAKIQSLFENKKIKADKLRAIERRLYQNIPNSEDPRINFKQFFNTFVDVSQSLDNKATRKLFETFQIQGTAMASVKRIKAYLHKVDVPEQLVKALFTSIDIDADGEIPIEEFQLLVHNADSYKLPPPGQYFDPAQIVGEPKKKPNKKKKNNLQDEEESDSLEEEEQPKKQKPDQLKIALDQNVYNNLQTNALDKLRNTVLAIQGAQNLASQRRKAIQIELIHTIQTDPSDVSSNGGRQDGSDFDEPQRSAVGTPERQRQSDENSVNRNKSNSIQSHYSVKEEDSQRGRKSNPFVKKSKFASKRGSRFVEQIDADKDQEQYLPEQKDQEPEEPKQQAELKYEQQERQTDQTGDQHQDHDDNIKQMDPSRKNQHDPIRMLLDTSPSGLEQKKVQSPQLKPNKALIQQKMRMMVDSPRMRRQKA